MSDKGEISVSAGRAAAAEPPKTTSRVWDAGVRLFHWLLVAGVATAALTGFFGSKQWLDVHLVAGVLVAVLLVVRAIWGLVGSTYARFSSFVTGPVQVLRHLGELIGGRAPVHAGHNPVGGVMIVALLVVLAALVATGTVVLGGRIKEGPLAPFTSFAMGAELRQVHELLAFGLMALIVVHVLGVVAESWRTRDNLAKAMVTGRKHLPPDAHLASPATAHPVLAGMASVVLLGASGAGIWHLSERPALGMPAIALDAKYVGECSACHAPHHPSLASAATWAGVMAGLDDHFGDNASLDAATTAAIAAWLSRNSAERWDSVPANLLRRPSEREKLRITATPGWRRAHRDVADEAFTRKSVGGKVNCVRCHGDADSGRFNPRAIAIPGTVSTTKGASGS